MTTGMEPGEAFSLSIGQQGWMTTPEDDLCSHGTVRLVVGGQVITLASDGDYGISEAALGLLRTLDSDHSPSARVTLFDCPLIPHGCGAILMHGCPIGIDWVVEHVGEGVRLHDVRVVDGVSGETRTFDADVVISREDYAREIGAFAVSAREFFQGIEKTFSDDFDRDQYQAFWEEYDSVLTRLGLISGT